VRRAYAAVRRWLRTARLSTRVSPSLRFAGRQLRRRPGVRRYRLRRTPYEVFLRHDGDDAFVLDEVLGPLQHYSFPDEVRRSLAGLEGPPRVLDLGANIGLFGLLASIELPGCELTAFEPDPHNAELLEACARVNGLAGRWRLIQALAAAADAERVPFLAGRSSRSRVADDRETGSGAIEVGAVDAFPHLERADLVKLDIEGGEWELLGDPRFAELAARAIVLEYHRFGCPGSDPGRAAVAALRGAGFVTRVRGDAGAASDPHEGVGTVWGWR
jgi:FkbM family methyltransferase